MLTSFADAGVDAGTAAMLELARYFAAHRPEHSMIFVGFDAEESKALNAERGPMVVQDEREHAADAAEHADREDRRQYARGLRRFAFPGSTRVPPSILIALSRG